MNDKRPLTASRGEAVREVLKVIDSLPMHERVLNARVWAAAVAGVPNGRWGWAVDTKVEYGTGATSRDSAINRERLILQLLEGNDG